MGLETVDRYRHRQDDQFKYGGEYTTQTGVDRQSNDGSSVSDVINDFIKSVANGRVPEISRAGLLTALDEGS